MNAESAHSLSQADRKTLLGVARSAIQHQLEKGVRLQIVASDYAKELQAQRASFVTLNRQSMLRGCIGHLEALKPLVEDVAENAFAAAFNDPRFPPLASHELADLEIHISVLTPSVQLPFASETDLLKQIRPYKDGLILIDGMHRGTFLPSVWEQLPEPKSFLQHLKRKAGLPEDYWSEQLQVFRYETESFS
ncbi:MAG: AmmeMemoRadiSam system protein A [Candidatus Thiodiazotropha sp. (ex Myrtea spinifera)]|nr:AmmeMemoRadiSam system protein A [Candidatus Thiodiazotropha sp. (ex Myrtea spinifera)]